MKWFKHISDSLDDPFISDLIDKHGLAAYGVFFGILEIYAREFKPDLDWKLRISMSYLRKKLQQTRNKLIENSLRTLKNSGKWELNFDNEQIEIFIPKFTELLDNWQQTKGRKKTPNYEVTTKLLRSKEVEVEVEVDKEVKERKKSTIPSLEEVTLYCKERGKGVDPQRWFDFYQAKGWLIGKNQMKDWRAAVRTWESGVNQKKESSEFI
jgi:hypothetical protein